MHDPIAVNNDDSKIIPSVRTLKNTEMSPQSESRLKTRAQPTGHTDLELDVESKDIVEDV